MATVRDIYTYFDRLFPRELSCAWDNDGLMVCRSSEYEVTRVLLTLDVTENTFAYAKMGGFDLIISHHPLIFRPLSSLSEECVSAGIPLSALSSKISVMSFHTRFDAGDGGMNDTLAKLLGLTVTGAFGPEGEENCGRICETEKTTVSQLCKKIKKTLSVPSLQVSKAGNHATKIALLGGDGKDFIKAAIKAGADTFITGSTSYNSMLDARSEGLTVIEAGHYFSEFLPFVSRFSELLSERFPEVAVEICPVGCEIQYI